MSLVYPPNDIGAFPISALQNCPRGFKAIKFFIYMKGILMDSPLEPSKFDFATDEGVSKFYMTAQAEFYQAISNLEMSMSEVTTVIHSIDLQLSPESQLKSIDNVLHKYILSWQTLHLFYQEVLKIKNIEFPKYYQDELYPR
jgi:hypothetical protein